MGVKKRCWVMPTKILKGIGTNVLRTVPPQNAFFFFRAIGAPTGAAARSLPDFLGIVSTIDLASVQFHMTRGDFENWIKMLGDTTLAKQISDLSGKKLRGEELRVQLMDVVKSRMDSLQKTA